MWMRLRWCALLAPVALLLSQTAPSDGPFLEKPYLQLGNAPKLSDPESLMLMWHAPPDAANWEVEVRTSKDSSWRAMDKPAFSTVNAPGIPEHLVYRARMMGLVPGQEFQYRVLKSGAPVFDSIARARRSAAQPFRLALFGDCAQGSPASKAIAYQASLAKPDFVFITGDIVYSAGRISDYRRNFFPVYNADVPSASQGAPLLRSIPFLAAPGNHDMALTNFARFGDALAYFLYWDQPLNGFVPSPSSHAAVHRLDGNQEAQPAFLAAASPRYPLMENFSFDYGNSHWTVIDSNPYLDWTNTELRDWVAKDLAGARSATWRFVAFHHPGFNSSKEHFTDQWMRSLSPVFEAGNVDIVFQGHVHNYQRTYPLTFRPIAQASGAMVGPRGEVAGEWKLDHAFQDGAGGATAPHGIIYITDGAGGAELYGVEQQSNPAGWQPFTFKFISEEHSLSVIDIDGRTFRLRQISDRGQEVDSFRIEK